MNNSFSKAALKAQRLNASAKDVLADYVYRVDCLFQSPVEACEDVADYFGTTSSALSVYIRHNLKRTEEENKALMEFLVYRAV